MGPVPGYVGHVFTSDFAFLSFLPLLLSSSQRFFSSGWEDGGLLSRNTAGWRNAGVGGLTGKLCLVIFNSWDVTFLMVFLDPLATRKPRAGLVSDHSTSTKCTEIIHASCIMTCLS